MEESCALDASKTFKLSLLSIVPQNGQPGQLELQAPALEREAAERGPPCKLMQSRLAASCAAVVEPFGNAGHLEQKAAGLRIAWLAPFHALKG